MLCLWFSRYSGLGLGATALTSAADDPRRHTDGHDVGRQTLGHHRAGPHDRSRANGHPVEHLHAEPQPDVILQHDIARRHDLLLADIRAQVIHAVFVGTKPAMWRDLHVATNNGTGQKALEITRGLDVGVIANDHAPPMPDLDDRTPVQMHSLAQPHLAPIMMGENRHPIVDKTMRADSQARTIDLCLRRDVRVAGEMGQETPILVRATHCPGQAQA